MPFKNVDNAVPKALDEKLTKFHNLLQERVSRDPVYRAIDAALQSICSQDKELPTQGHYINKLSELLAKRGNELQHEVEREVSLSLSRREPCESEQS